MATYSFKDRRILSGLDPDNTARALNPDHTAAPDNKSSGVKTNNSTTAKGAANQLAIRIGKDILDFCLVSDSKGLMVAMPIIFTLCIGGLMWLAWYLNIIGG